MKAKRLKRRSIEPLYRQLVGILKNEIAAYPEGSRFYTDRDICRTFGVSQSVARQALSLLVDEGYIRRAIPKGTFVESRNAPATLTKHRKLAVLCPVEAYLQHTLAIKGIQEVASEGGYETIVMASDPQQEMDRAEVSLNRIKSLMDTVDGVVWVSSVLRTLKLPAFFHSLSRRIVFVNVVVYDERFSCVVADYETAVYRLVEHLLEMGRRHIGYVGGEKTRWVSTVRYRGFEKAMLDNNLALERELVVPYTGSFVQSEGYRVVLEMLRGGTRPDAIVAIGDFMAMGVMEGIKASGLGVPQDIAVTGFDDLPEVSRTTPPLTTARQPYYGMGKSAARLLLDQLHRAGEPGERRYVACPLVCRESTGVESPAAKVELMAAF